MLSVTNFHYLERGEDKIFDSYTAYMVREYYQAVAEIMGILVEMIVFTRLMREHVIGYVEVYEI